MTMHAVPHKNEMNLCYYHALACNEILRPPGSEEVLFPKIFASINRNRTRGSSNDGAADLMNTFVSRFWSHLNYYWILYFSFQRPRWKGNVFNLLSGYPDETVYPDGFFVGLQGWRRSAIPLFIFKKEPTTNYEKEGQNEQTNTKCLPCRGHDRWAKCRPGFSDSCLNCRPGFRFLP